MKLNKLVLIKVILSFVFCLPVIRPDVLAQPIKFENVLPGIERFEGEVAIQRETVKLTLIRVDTNRYSVNIVASEALESGSTLLDYLFNAKASVVISGGFLKSFFPPLPEGLVKIENKTQNRSSYNPLLNGMFCVSKSKFLIDEYSEELDKTWNSCLQMGPLLIQDSKKYFDKGVFIEDSNENNSSQSAPGNSIENLFDKKSLRAFIASDTKNRILLGITTNLMGSTSKVILEDLTDFLLVQKEAGKPIFKQILNISGIRAGLALDNKGKIETYGFDNFFLPNAIMFKMK